MATSDLLFSSLHQREYLLSHLSIFRVQLALIFLSPIVLYLVRTIRKDYHAFLALGPGGTPSTPAGYIRICILRLFTLRDPLDPPSIPQTLHPKTGFLSQAKIPTRLGSRPTVAGIAPQRQITQKPGPAMYDALASEIHRLAHEHPNTLYTATSCFEKHSTGIFYRLPATTTTATSSADPPKTAYNTHSHRITCNGEVCHSHPSDGSLHLTLHPADVRLVLERGWAQRHPLARDSWWWVTRLVPPGFVMIYAPRNEEDLKVVVEIIRAAAWWVGGKEVQ